MFLVEACVHLSSYLKFKLQLKPEQRNAVEYLLNHDDVLAVLPTGYGKSLIFQLFAPAACCRFALVDMQTPAETFPKFPSALRVIDRSDRNPPITAR